MYAILSYYDAEPPDASDVGVADPSDNDSGAGGMAGAELDSGGAHTEAGNEDEPDAMPPENDGTGNVGGACGNVPCGAHEYCEAPCSGVALLPEDPIPQPLCRPLPDKCNGSYNFV